jgi:hypothetical protein
VDPEDKTKVCYRCEKTESQVDLLKCPICFKLYCDDCGHMHGGRKFCSKFCAEYFFFSDPDSEEI